MAGRPRTNPPDMQELERVKIDRHDYLRLVALSKHTGASMAWHRRQALRQYLDSRSPSTTPN